MKKQIVTRFFAEFIVLTVNTVQYLFIEARQQLRAYLHLPGKLIQMSIKVNINKLDGVGPVDNRPSTD